MNRDIRMLAIDLDETLLRNDNTISEYTRQVLRKALAQGVRIVIATGRMWSSARRIARSLELGDVPLIAYSGALIAKCESGEILYHQPIPVDIAQEALAAAKEYGAFTQAYVNDQLYVPHHNERVRYYEEHCGVEAKDLGEEYFQLQHAPTKIIFNETPERIQEIRKWIIPRLQGKVNFVQSSPYFLEMVAPHINKGVGVEQLVLRYGLTMQQVMAFGNAQNDMGMLLSVGWPVAVANAIDELKAVAGYIAPSNEEDGVAKTVARWVLEEE